MIPPPPGGAPSPSRDRAQGEGRREAGGAYGGVDPATTPTAIATPSPPAAASGGTTTACPVLTAYPTVATGTRDGQAYLAVTNGGPAIGEDVTPLLFEPFRRLNGPAGSVPGTGLGLSIVRSVTTAHHGTVTARSRPAGGLDVSVLLPGVEAEVPGRAEAATAG